MEESSKGPLLIIGGGEDKTGDCVVLRHAFDLFGGREAHIAVVATASTEGHEAGAVYKQIFTDFGAAAVAVLEVSSRDQAEQSDTREAVERASGIFFTGGDQLRITSILGGTSLARALFRARKRGAAIAGTSAGASMMSATMIVDGAGDASALRGMTHMSPGVGFFESAVIDQHFAQRGRINRLLAAVAQNPALLGIGLDEDTAISVRPDGIFEVVGSQTVTIVDGSHLTFTNVSERSPKEALTLSDITLHVLSGGHRYDVGARRPIVSSG